MLKAATQIPPILLLALANDQANHDFATGPAMEIALASAVAGQAAAPPVWVQVMPAPDANSEIRARDGRKWTLRDPAVLLAHFEAYGADLPMDKDHAVELKAPLGEEAPAQAWIKELTVREDRTVWARPDWTKPGADAVLSHAYRYISPAMLHDEAGNITGLSSVALVTRPALRMPALAGDRRRNPHDKETPMTVATVALAALAGAAGLASTSTEADVLAAITANAASARDLKDPTKFVPAADLAAALTRATTAEATLATQATADKEATALAAVEGAIAEGKLAPASKDHWLSIARDNGEAFKLAVAAMPVVLKPTDAGKKLDAETGDENGLTTDQVALCSQMGLDPKAYAATLKETK